MVSVIRAERQRRLTLLKDEDGDWAYDQWLFTDEPFVNELCLVLLVAIRHQIERELLRLLARLTVGGNEVGGSEYRRRLRNERKLLRKRDGWTNAIARLDLRTFPEWHSSIETLRLLANRYKHDPLGDPDEGLLKHLQLDLTKCASLPETLELGHRYGHLSPLVAVA
jgi:hypothetical protein